MVYRSDNVRMTTGNAQMQLKNMNAGPFYVFEISIFKELCFFFLIFQSLVLRNTLKKQATYYQRSAINCILFATVWRIPSTEISPISFCSFYLESVKCLCMFSPSVLSNTASLGCGKRSLSVPRSTVDCNSLMVVESRNLKGPVLLPCLGSHCWSKYGLDRWPEKPLQHLRTLEFL